MLYGPGDHENTQTQSIREDELIGMLWSAKRSMTGETCGLVDTP
jgi:hypothetical protein